VATTTIITFRSAAGWRARRPIRQPKRLRRQHHTGASPDDEHGTCCWKGRRGEEEDDEDSSWASLGGGAQINPRRLRRAQRSFTQPPQGNTMRPMQALSSPAYFSFLRSTHAACVRICVL